ncbi:unnamed protein product [Blepharisma stoltei]|uniref:NADH dehydrogenase [ubiquinone] 1 alpha subcomplex subunit 12 n=1 Tax=Blepharisma stoltei TaxID=1481888 RepID=A0AAU9IVI7_9CILI|nr:unnamed protein product [Blepharisma stoltei]
MVGWGIDSILSGRFMKIFRMEGFIRTLERGRIVRFRNITDHVGSRGVAKCVGQDSYGNRYYEDFHGDDCNESFVCQRWVEYADRHDMWQTGRKVPAEWHAWLHRINDDVPSPDNSNYHHPIYKRKHLPNQSGLPGATVPLGDGRHEYAKQFQTYIKSRIYTSWEPQENAPKKRYD